MAVVERLREPRLPLQFLFGEAGPETDVVGLGLRMQRGEPLGVQAGAGDEIAAGRKDAILDQYRLKLLRVAHEGLLFDAMPRRPVVMAHARMPLIQHSSSEWRSSREASEVGI